MQGGRVWAGVLAPVVWLGGAAVMSLVEQGFMDDLGWDVWPSGLALGPQGWGQIAVFVVFDLLYLAFALHLLGLSGTRPMRWSARLLALGAGCAFGLPFRTDRPGGPVSWHGVLHAIGYLGMMLTLIAAMLLLYPALVRRSRLRDWSWAPLALLLLPAAWAMPDPTATSSYLFFAVPFTLLAALSLRLARGAPVVTR